MRIQLLFTFFVLISFFAQCQQDSTIIDSIPENNLHRTEFEFSSGKPANFIHYNQQSLLFIFNNQKDTIYLSNVDVGQFTESSTSTIVDTIQIDGKGSKEVIICRSLRGSTAQHDSQGSTTDKTELSQYEIWDLDTRTMLFQKIVTFQKTWNHQRSLLRMDAKEYEKMFGPRQGTRIYNYAVEIREDGTLIFKLGLSTDKMNKMEQYSFVNGTYIQTL